MDMDGIYGPGIWRVAYGIASVMRFLSFMHGWMDGLASLPAMGYRHECLPCLDRLGSLSMRIAHLPRTEIYETHQNTRRGYWMQCTTGKLCWRFPFVFFTGEGAIPFSMIPHLFAHTLFASSLHSWRPGCLGLVLMDALPDLRMGRWEGEGSRGSFPLSIAIYLFALWSFEEWL